MASRSRYFLFIAIPTLALLLVALAVGLMMPEERVTKANFDRIEIGMTYSRVADIFGSDGVEWTGHGDFTFDRKWVAADNSQAGIGFLNGLVIEKTWIPPDTDRGPMNSPSARDDRRHP